MLKMNCFVHLIVVLISLNCVLSVKDAITLDRDNDLQNLMNTSVDPCENFFEYSCGNYKNVYRIPDFLAKYENMDRMTQENYIQLHSFLNEEIEGDENSAENKAKLFHALCNNMTAIENQGNEPLVRLLDTLGGFPALVPNWSSPNFNWMNLLIRVHKVVGENFIFDQWIEYRDRRRVINGSLPAFSVLTQKLTKEDNEKIWSILNAVGLTNETANNTIERYFDFADKLGNLTKFIGANTAKAAHFAEFKKLVPDFGFERFLYEVHGINLEDDDYMAVYGVGFFQKLKCFLDKQSALNITNFVMINVVNELLPALSQRFVDIKFEEDKKKLGLKASAPRWRQCTNLITNVLNNAAATLYIRKNNLADVRDHINRILNEIKTLFRNYLQNSSWPGNNTKQTSFDKVNKFYVDLSWENFVRNTSALNLEHTNFTVNRSSFFDTYLSARRLKIKNEFAYFRTNAPESWPFELVSAEAFMVPWDNKFSIHPGMLRSPFYHTNFSKYQEYSGIGLTIAHELFHSFDTLGSEYDADGLYRNWWEGNEEEEFNNKTKCFKEQYDNFTLHNVSFTNRQADFENIADNIATKFIYMFYEQYLNTSSDLSDETIANSNLTSRQLLFVSMAQSFCTTVRPEAAKHYIVEDPHAAGQWRPIGIVQNSEGFAKAFNCSLNSPMNPSKKCSIFE